MIHQLNMYGKDRVQVAIERIRMFEPKEGYYLAFSGGKDSCVVKRLMEMSGVKFDAHYNVTSVDPPELVRFIKEYHKDVEFSYPRDKDGNVITMWNLIPKKGMPPTRIVRYCCKELKEGSGDGRFVVTGIRWAESVNRSKRGGLELAEKKTQRMTGYDVDNADEKMISTCQMKRRRMLNPIIDWSTDDVWEFIKEFDVPYCCLYDQGFSRLGCIGCPMGTPSHRRFEFERYPKYKAAYLKAFEKMVAVNIARGGRSGVNSEQITKDISRYGRPREVDFCNATKEQIFQWWIN